MSNFAKFMMLMFIGLILAVVCLWFIGGKKQEYTTTVSINAAPEVVFSYLTDVDLMKKWIPGLVAVEPLSDVPFQVGSKSRTIIEENGERVEYEEEILRFQVNETLSVCARNANEISTSIYKLDGDQGKTNLTYKIKSTPSGLNRMLAPFLDDQTQQKIDDNALKLKRLIEKEAPGNVTSQFDQGPTVSAGTGN
jgi:uncharacterized membrane protein